MNTMASVRTFLSRWVTAPSGSLRHSLRAQLRPVLLTLLPAALCAQFAQANPLMEKPAAGQPASYVGSSSCRECHEKFYKLWSTSFHGLAMQPYTAALAQAQLTPH